MKKVLASFEKTFAFSLFEKLKSLLNIFLILMNNIIKDYLSITLKNNFLIIIFRISL